MKSERKDWCKLPYAVILDENLSNWTAKCVYAILLDISKDCVVMRTTKSLAELTGLSPRQIFRILNELQKAGYIVSRKTDGRKLILEIKPLSAQKKEQQNDEAAASSEQEETENFLKTLLGRKLETSNEERINEVFESLKTEALARIKDKSKLAAYMAAMIRNYQKPKGNSDGFDADKYDVCVNNFPDDSKEEEDL